MSECQIGCITSDDEGRGYYCEECPERRKGDAFTLVGPDGFTRLEPATSEAQWNALEMARKAELAERRAEDAEAEVERLKDLVDARGDAGRIEARAVELATERDAALARIARAERLIDSWEHDAADHSNPVFIGRLRECLRRDPAPVRLRGDK